MKLEIQYTDILYTSKKEVADQIGVHLIEPVWKQISTYRNEYMIKIDDAELCLCPGILKKMLQLKSLLFALSFSSCFLNEAIRSENGRWMMNHFLKTESTFEKRLHQLCLMYHKNEQIILTMNQNCPYVLVFVFWIMMKYGQDEFGILLLVLKLKCSGMLSLLSLIDVDDFMIDRQQDMTYSYDCCLTSWISKAQKTAVHHESECNDQSSLIYQYPQLKAYQIQFYLNHHVPGHYYTIEHFMQCTDVCYETGRTALQQLVSLGFYQKMKQGKKFVYTAR